MRIAYNILGTYNSGGMERVLSNKANWLVKNGYDITIITTDQKNRSSFFSFSKKIKMIDLDINYCDNQGVGIIRKTINHIKKVELHKKRLSALLFSEKFDIVISMFGNEADFLWKIKDGSSKVVEIHFSKFFRSQCERRGLWGMVDSWRSKKDVSNMKRYDRFIALTQEDKSYWKELNNVEVIYNAVTFSPTEQAQLCDKKVIAVGRHSHQKGFDMLIDAWGIVYAKHPDWKLSIIGGGELLDSNKERIINAKLTEGIELMSPISSVEQEFLSSSIYAMSSRYEGFGMVLIEAMSCGVPAVSFACKCGPRDIIEDGVSGMLVEPNDVEKLAEGVCKLIENPELRKAMGAEAAKQVKAKFAEERIMKQWVELFDQLVKK